MTVPAPPPKCILLVDDEERILSALERTLRREGYELLTARSPREALRVLDQSPQVDLVLTDQKMPGMSGVELLAQVAKARPQVIRMLITGWANAGATADPDAPVIAAVIPKPWEDAELKDALRKALF